MSDGSQTERPVRSPRAGIVLVVLAVLVGLVLLAKGYSGSSPSQISGSSKDGSATTVVVTTSTTLPAQPVDQVVVKVVNASGVSGLATRQRDKLLAKGYTQVSLGDAPGANTQTVVYYGTGAQGDAQAVARAIGTDPLKVQPLPEPPPVSPGNASVLVMVGSDLN